MRRPVMWQCPSISGKRCGHMPTIGVLILPLGLDPQQNRALANFLGGKKAVELSWREVPSLFNFAMRLLDSFNLQLKDFPADRIPSYAILSHTWEDDEVSFADVEQGNAECKAGYTKIRRSCQQSTSQGLEYIWIDTCCIDKSSSAELSEAINSMYSWYKKATICYAYLADVPATLGSAIEKADFANSRWFKRGWTLQELIGPSNIVFFSREWIEIGTKATLCQDISTITGISISILTDTTSNKSSLESTSIAKRMSWASKRMTTRTEDIAYCLMGLFDVNMPLLYGEGEKAFIRLQEEIIKYSDDQSLFAWTDPTAAANHHVGLLATSPTHFVNSGDFIPYSEWGPSDPFSISNKGLRIELHLSPNKEARDLYVAALYCPVPPDYDQFLGIYLRRVYTSNHQYVRAKPHALCNIPVRGTKETVYVRSFGLHLQPRSIYPLHVLQLRQGPAEDHGYKLIEFKTSSKDTPPPISTPKFWPRTARKPLTFKIDLRSDRLAGMLLLERDDHERLAILLGSTSDFGVGFQAIPMSDDQVLDDVHAPFRPQPPEKLMHLPDHRVRVSAHPQIHNGAKYYMVNLEVEAIYHAPNPLNIIRELIPGEQSREHARNENVSRGLRFKFPFRSSRT